MATALEQLQAQFARDVGAGTGIDPAVIFAQEQVEGAYAPGGTGAFNMLNLRPYPGDPYSGVSSGGFEQFSSLSDAETATIRRFRQPFVADQLGRYPHTALGEITAISASGWDAGHYQESGKNSLLQQYLSDHGVSAGPSNPELASPLSTGVSPQTGVMNPNAQLVSLNANPLDFFGIGSSISSGFGTLAHYIAYPFEQFYALVLKGVKFITSESIWIRIGLFVLGLAVILVGFRAALA